jgi:SAM-dependent methyltransferase
VPDESPEAFYDGLAATYDALFPDWWAAAQHHGEIVDAVIRGAGTAPPARLLDCAAGIGTQALPLATRGYDLTATDISAEAVARARSEAETRDITLHIDVADMRTLDRVVTGPFDVVIACDNAIPHLLDDDDLDRALGAIAAVLAPNALFVASIRDYDALRAAPPLGLPGVTYDRDDGLEITGQAWEWSPDLERIRIHLYFLREQGSGWHADVHTTWYRALTRAAFTAALERARFHTITWLSPEQSGYYQPMVTARSAR